MENQENQMNLNKGITSEETTPSIDVTLNQIEKDRLIENEIRKITDEMSEEFEIRDDEYDDETGEISPHYRLRLASHIKSNFSKIKEEAAKRVEYMLREEKADSIMNTKQKISSKVREIILKIFPSLNNQL